MKTTRRLPALAAAGIIALAGCKGTSSGPAVLTVDDITGTWAATQLQLAAQQNPQMAVELVGIGGSFSITIGAGGTYTQTATFPGGQPETDSGTFSLTNATGSTATAVMAGEGGNSVSFSMEKVGNTITMEGSEDMEFPMPGAPPGEIPVDINIVMTRQ